MVDHSHKSSLAVCFISSLLDFYFRSMSSMSEEEILLIESFYLIELS